MYFALDLILLLIITATIIFSYRRGFVASVLSLASLIVSSVTAWIFHAPLADFISSAFLVDSFSSAVKEKIHFFSKGGNLDSLFTEIPFEFSEFLTNNGLDPARVSDEFADAGLSAAAFADNLSVRIGSALAYLVANAISLILLFVTASILCAIASIFIKAVFKLPILNGANKALGLILGIFAALVLAWIFSHCASTFINGISVLYPDIIDVDILDKTILIKLFSDINPFALLF